MKLEPWHLVVGAGAVVAFGAWRVMSSLKDAYNAGTLNPASADNIVYKAASTPFDGSLGVWLWEKLHPNQVKASQTAAVNARAAAAVAARRKRQISPSAQTAADIAKKPQTVPAAAEQRAPDMDATGTGGW